MYALVFIDCGVVLVAALECNSAVSAMEINVFHKIAGSLQPQHGHIEPIGVTLVFCPGKPACWTSGAT
jgi:hypothetical protein